MQFGQQLVAVGDESGTRRVDEREADHLAEAERLHAQDDARQRRAQQLGIGESWTVAKVDLVVEADADAVGHAAAAPGALVGRGLRHLLDQQLFDLVARRIALHPRGAGIDHVADAGHGERGLGHVGGEHDSAQRARGLEDRVLLGHRQPGKQRQNFGARGMVLPEGLGSVADLALARQKDQDVTRTHPRQLVGGIEDSGNQVGRILVLLLAFAPGRRRRLLAFDRPPADFHRVGAPRYLDHRGVVEMLRETLGVDGGRGDHHAQVTALFHQRLQVAQQEIDVEAALVRLVDDDRVVAAQERVALALGQQDAVGHHLDRGVVAHGVGEAHLVADPAAEFAAQFLCDARRHRARGDAARLGAADQPAWPRRL